MWSWEDQFIIEIILLLQIYSLTSHWEFLVETVNCKKIGFMNVGYEPAFVSWYLTTWTGSYLEAIFLFQETQLETDPKMCGPNCRNSLHLLSSSIALYQTQSINLKKIY